MHVRTLLFAAAMSAALATVASAEITGKVKLDGEAPEARQIDMSGVKECNDQHPDPVFDDVVMVDDEGNLANVVVFIKTDDPGALGGDVPSTPAVLDQQGCVYVPHVLPMMAGQELIIKNSDPFLHNVHSLAQINPAFNFGQPNKDPGKKVDSPRAAENIKVKCDVHPWMSAYIVVLEHPFFGVSQEDGSFTIPGELPDGEYTLQAWHERFGTQEVQVSVQGGKAELSEPITFKAEGAMAEPVNPEVRLASLEAGKKSDGCGSGCCGAGAQPQPAAASAR
jgi:hypothetical protein